MNLPAMNSPVPAPPRRTRLKRPMRISRGAPKNCCVHTDSPDSTHCRGVFDGVCDSGVQWSVHYCRCLGRGRVRDGYSTVQYGFICCVTIKKTKRGREVEIDLR